ncbi:caspase family protein [Haliea salexigens]|uniref:caspase family protein n=1 Tax=Haliea salexigens TaxID=287487 RepID=UPI00040F4D8D|nr:caspase family protein [Haliea salexigens]
MKVLVAVGCDHYSCDELSNLAGAENDASAIFEALVNSDTSIYDKKHSILLHSPTSQEVKEAIQSIIFVDVGIELSFFFAGHGGVKDGAYFLCASDTMIDRLTVSALGMTELFMWLNEANVRDSNIVIDACQAGGIAYDVATFLKPTNIGALGTPSLSVLAAAAADQNAREINGHGIATAALLKCLSGEECVLADRPSLSLSEIGYSVAELMSSNDQQAPVNWGLNLFGRTQFCRNPCFAESKTPVIGLPEGLRSGVVDAIVIAKHTNRIWELYLTSSNHFDAISFLRLTQSVLSDLPPESEAAPAIVDGLANTFLPLLAGSSDPFEEVELLGACIASLLRYVDDQVVASIVSTMAKQLVGSISSAARAVCASLEENEYHLLSDHTALADLYFLPIRILRILGWLGAAKIIADTLEGEVPHDAPSTEELVRKILELYACSIVAVSDEQACGLVVFLCAAQDMNLSEEAEQIFGLLCHSFHRYKGRVAVPQLSGSGAYRFTRSRAAGNKSTCEELIASPTEFLSALLLASEKMSLTDIIDDFIEDFDHVPGNLFVPGSYAIFADERIVDGVNYTYMIGHGVWAVRDFCGTWDAVCKQIEKDSGLKSGAAQIGAICAALVQQDRTPWFIWR